MKNKMFSIFLSVLIVVMVVTCFGGCGKSDESLQAVKGKWQLSEVKDGNLTISAQDMQMTDFFLTFDGEGECVIADCNGETNAEYTVNDKKVEIKVKDKSLLAGEIGEDQTLTVSDFAGSRMTMIFKPVEN